METSQTFSSIPDIVIVGGGAGGLELATKLGNKLGKKGRARITLIDSTRTHIWKPLLHQVASGASDPADHALEYLAQASWHGFEFRLGTMDGLDRVAKKIHLAPVYNESGEMIIPEREFPYDTLVLSVGSVGNDFGIPGVKEHCLFLDTKAQAVGFQKKLLETLIRVNTQQRKVEAGQLDVAIVGGGATGVELAAQLHQVTRQLTQYGLDVVNPDSDIRISVIDAGARVLPMLPEHISAQVTRELAKLGIDVISQAKVTKVSPAGIEINNDKVIPAAISVWAAGIKAPEFLSTSGTVPAAAIGKVAALAMFRWRCPLRPAYRRPGLYLAKEGGVFSFTLGVSTAFAHTKGCLAHETIPRNGRVGNKSFNVGELRWLRQHLSSALNV